MKRVVVVIPLAVTVVLWSSAALAQDAASLLKSKNCGICHALDQQLAGPSYWAIAKRYANDPNAPKTLAQSIVNGVSGKYGPIPMPATAGIQAEEVTTLVGWILSQTP